MEYKTFKTQEWQEQGGVLDIPDGWFVSRVDLDARDPHVEISTMEGSEPQVLLIPKSLAYYLGTHFCGSEVMRQNIEDDTRRGIRNKIKDALGF